MLATKSIDEVPMVPDARGVAISSPRMRKGLSSSRNVSSSSASDAYQHIRFTCWPLVADYLWADATEKLTVTGTHVLTKDLSSFENSVDSEIAHYLELRQRSLSVAATGSVGVGQQYSPRDGGSQGSPRSKSSHFSAFSRADDNAYELHSSAGSGLSQPLLGIDRQASSGSQPTAAIGPMLVSGQLLLELRQQFEHKLHLEEETNYRGAIRRQSDPSLRYTTPQSPLSRKSHKRTDSGMETRNRAATDSYDTPRTRSHGSSVSTLDEEKLLTLVLPPPIMAPPSSPRASVAHRTQSDEPSASSRPMPAPRLGSSYASIHALDGDDDRDVGYYRKGSMASIIAHDNDNEHGDSSDRTRSPPSRKEPNANAAAAGTLVRQIAFRKESDLQSMKISWVNCRWRFQPVLDSRLFSKLYGSRVFSAFHCLFWVLWCITCLILRIFHPAILAIAIITISLGIPATLTAVDRKVLSLSVRQFEAGFLMIYGLIFCVGVVASTLEKDALFASITLLCSIACAIFAACNDPLIRANAAQKTAFSFIFTTMAGCLLVLDLVGYPLFASETKLCIFFCADARRAVVIASVQFFAFGIKYLVANFRVARSGASKASIFVGLSFPVYCRITKVRAENQQPLLRLIHISTQVPKSFKLVSDGYNPSEPTPYIHRAFAFQPLNPFSWAAKIADNSVYICIVGFCALSLLSFNFFNAGLALNIIALLVISTAFFFESTRFDRTLLKCTLVRFDFYVLLLGILLYLVFGLWSTLPASENRLLIFQSFVTWVAGTLLVLLGDAAPGYPRLLRGVILLVLIINSCYVILREELSASPVFDRIPVCFIFCGDTRVLAFSGLVTATIMMLRYLFYICMRPNRCLLLRTKVLYTVDRNGEIEKN